MIHNCNYCNDLFDGKVNAKYCSDNCKQRAYYHNHKLEDGFKERNRNFTRNTRKKFADRINKERRDKFANDTKHRLKVKRQVAKSRLKKPQNTNNKLWRLNNPYKALLKNLRKRGKRLVSEKDLRLIFDRDNFSCVYCGSKDSLSVDHKMPVCRGGDSTIDNLCLACISCNSRKGKKTVEEFLQYRKEVY